MVSARVSRVGFVLFSSTMMSAALALSACSAGGGGSGGSSEKLVQDFSSCDQKPDVGASALAGNASKTEWVQADYFSKPYDKYDLEAVLNASSLSTTNYVQSLGIGLFKVPRTNMAGQCPTYFNLPTAPADSLQKIWNEAAGGDTGNGKLAGLFFEFCGIRGTPGCRAREMVQPTILLDEASDRWTLVHEMMHYNFNQGRKASADIQTNGELKSAMDRTSATLKKSMDDFEKLPNRQDLQTAADSLQAWFEIGKQIAIRRSLEEMTIEGMLIDEWAAGRLENVHSDSPRSGVWYMNFSRDQYIATLASLDPLISKIKLAANSNFWTEISNQTDAIALEIDQTRNETKAMIDNSKYKIKKVTKTTDDSQFFRAPTRFGGLDNVSTGRPAANDKTYAVKKTFSKSQLAKENLDAAAATKAHLDSHDPGGLGQSFEAMTRNLVKTLQ